jgi:hypothetical protein
MPAYGAVLARGRDAHGHYKLLDQVPSADVEHGIADYVAYREWHKTTFRNIAR